MGRGLPSGGGIGEAKAEGEQGRAAVAFISGLIRLGGPGEGQLAFEVVGDGAIFLRRTTSAMPPPSVPGSQAATKASLAFSSRFTHMGRPDRNTATVLIP